MEMAFVKAGMNLKQTKGNERAKPHFFSDAIEIFCTFVFVKKRERLSVHIFNLF